MLFCNGQRKKVQKDLSDGGKSKISQVDVAKKLGELWNKLDATKKAKYTSKAKKQAAAYQEKLAKYKQSKKYQTFAQAKKEYLTKKKAALKQFYNAEKKEVIRELREFLKRI